MKINNMTGMLEIPAKVRNGLQAAALQVSTLRSVLKSRNIEPTGEDFKGIVSTFESNFKGMTVKITDDSIELCTSIGDNRTPKARFMDYEVRECKPKKKVLADGKTHSSPCLALNLDMACPTSIYLHSETGNAQSTPYDLRSVANALIDAATAIIGDLDKAEAPEIE